MEYKEAQPGPSRHGSPIFYALLEEMANTHDRKSHDYASNDNPYGNYHYAGQVSSLFAHSFKDAGFAGRIAEKVYRLANLEGSQKNPSNESIQDTEIDICVITLLWMADRRQRRFDKGPGNPVNQTCDGGQDYTEIGTQPIDHPKSVGLRGYNPEEVRQRSQKAMQEVINEIGFITPQDILQLDAYIHHMANDIKHPVKSDLIGNRKSVDPSRR